MKAIHTETVGRYTIQIVPDDSGLTFDELMGEGHGIHVDIPRYCQIGEHTDEPARGYVRFVLHAYVHGGVALSLGRRGQFADPWDSGVAGYIDVPTGPYAGRPDYSPEAAAEATVEAANMVLRRDVYGFVIEKDGEHVDSCFGCVSEYDGYVLEEARYIARYYAEQDRTQTI